MIDLNAPELYFNRELSWLRFNSRVLAQALDVELPPLERLKFLAIYGTNLDEFYMIRVAGLKALYAARVQETGSDKLTPSEQLSSIREYIHNEQAIIEGCYTDILKQLQEHGMNIKSYKALNAEQTLLIEKKFFKEIYPVIIPIAVDSTHPFPHLNNLSFGIALTLADNVGNIKHGLIRIPRILPRFIEIDHIYVPIESVVKYHVQHLFPGFTLVDSTPFRVTRNADIAIEEEEADDFLEILEEGLRARNKGSLVRLELIKNASEDLVKFLEKHIMLTEDDIYYYKSVPLNLGSLWQVVGNKAFSHLISPTFTPKTLPPLHNENIFEAMKKQDILLYHPFDSYDPIVKYIEQAASDRNTVTIRMTLYRAGSNSPIVKALIAAVNEGIQVTALVELKARFDEENNLVWAKALEDAGAHVVYGIPGLKVHAKIAQVMKRENGELQSYLHLATGNYNPGTAKVYTDMSYFTARKELNDDATRFFHYLTGYSLHTELSTLYMSPTQIKPKLLELIKEESTYGTEGHIILKANALVDANIIRALYRASLEGCKVDLIIRGVCCLKPQVAGVSENIRVFSIVGKYLEHPRIYFFKHNEVNCYISSADLMPRNLVRRVELMTPILDKQLAKRAEQILHLQLKDNQRRWELGSDGEYTKVTEGDMPVNNHQTLENYTTKIYDKTRKKAPDYVQKLAARLLKDS